MSKRILIADDWDMKANDAERVIKQTINNPNIEKTECIRDTLVKLMEGNTEILILDMQMPRYENNGIEEVEREAGLEILTRIQYQRKQMGNVKVIILSSDEDIKRKVEERNMGDYCPAITYDPSYENWEKELEEELKKVI